MRFKIISTVGTQKQFSILVKLLVMHIITSQEQIMFFKELLSWIKNEDEIIKFQVEFKEINDRIKEQSKCLSIMKQEVRDAVQKNEKDTSDIRRLAAEFTEVQPAQEEASSKCNEAEDQNVKNWDALKEMNKCMIDIAYGLVCTPNNLARIVSKRYRKVISTFLCGMAAQPLTDEPRILFQEQEMK